MATKKSEAAEEAKPTAKRAAGRKSAAATKTAAASKATATTKAVAASKSATASKASTAGKTAAASKTASASKTAATTKAATAKAAATTKAAASEPAAKSATTTTGKSTAARKSTKKSAAKAAASSEPAAKQAVAETAASSEPAAKKTATKAAASSKPAAKKTTRKPAAKKAAQKEKAASEPATAPVEAVAPAAPEPAVAPIEEKATAPATPEPAAPVDASAQEASEPPAAPVEAAGQEAPEPYAVGGVLIAAAECTPLVKIGGLADVVGALPKYLAKLGIDARVVMPFHRQIKDQYADKTTHIADFQASLGWRSQYVGLEKLVMDGVTYYFIDNEFYFGGPVYCGGEFEGEQYAFFTRAVMDAIPLFDFDVRVLHCNDWHTAMMPLLAKTQYQGGVQSGLKTLLTIHNLHFQGQFSHEFDRDLLRVDDSLATPQFIEHYGCDNMLKAGIVFADKVNTVSPTYAREICEPFLGESLDGVLRSRGEALSGILNGIDNDVWNPETDPNLAENFTKDSIGRKAALKRALFEELGLQQAPEGEEVPLISMVGRLTPQKGLDLVQCVLDDIMAENVRMVVLGSGDAEFENFLRDAENRYKGRLCSYIGYAGELSHRIYAASDLFLMPSLFEPCGISQMISMRYGTLPIVRETGGLKDTVVPYNEYTGAGNGFSFANYNAHEMLGTIRYALWVWRNAEAREALARQAMETDYGFERCARSYAELYQSL